jgi:hypothetical protein
MHVRTRLRRTLVLAASLVPLGACMTWGRRPIPAPGRDDFFPGPVRVTRTEGLPIYLGNVTVGHDSVIGRELIEPHTRVAIPRSQVRMVEARRTDPLATVVVVVLSTAAAATAFVAVMFATFGTGG